jgi:hypothetical protein
MHHGCHVSSVDTSWLVRMEVSIASGAAEISPTPVGGDVAELLDIDNPAPHLRHEVLDVEG